MKKEFDYMFKIEVQEITRTKKLFVLMYGIIILFSSILYMQDFSMKVTGNLILMMWISLITLLGVKVFIENERESLFVLSKIPLATKYVRLTLLQCIINLPIFLTILVQLYVMKQNIFIVLLWAILSYIFSIMLGLFLGNTVSKKTGLIILMFIFAYNFFFVNAYRQTEYSFIFAINEYIFNLDKINIISFCKMLAAIFLGIFSVLMRRNHIYSIKRKYILLPILIVGFIIIESSLFVAAKIESRREPQIKLIEGHEVTFKNINPDDYVKGVELLAKLQKSYLPFGGSKVEKYEINKIFLSSFGWKFVDQEDLINLDKNDLRVNIYSLSALNFYEPSVVINNCDDFILLWKTTIDKYNRDNRYFKHILDGASEVIKRNVVYETFGESNAVYKQTEKDMYSIYDAPITKYNYVKRIGLLTADKYENQLIQLVDDLDKFSIKTDKQFVDLLQEKYPKIYEDTYIHNFLESIIEE